MIASQKYIIIFNNNCTNCSCNSTMTKISVVVVLQYIIQSCSLLFKIVFSPIIINDLLSVSVATENVQLENFNLPLLQATLN